MLVYGFWSVEEFTGLVARDFTLGTYAKLLEPAHRDIILRTFVMATAVSVACAVLAFPLAYYMARYATSRMKTVLYLVAIMPLWSSYLVRALAWRQSSRTRDHELGGWSDSVWTAGRSSTPRSSVALGDPVVLRAVHRVRLPVAAVHDPAGGGGARACAPVLPRGLE